MWEAWNDASFIATGVAMTMAADKECAHLFLFFDPGILASAAIDLMTGGDFSEWNEMD